MDIRRRFLTQHIQLSNKIYYTTNDGNAVEIKMVNSIYPFNSSVVSNTYDDEKECWVIECKHGIYSFNDHAFSGCDSLTSITIPDGVTSIGDYAFSGCDSLTSITIPNSVTSIGEEVFYDCSSLTEFKGTLASEDGSHLIFGDRLVRFAPRCNLTEYNIYNIPTTISSIDEYAFQDCSNFKSITIPESVTTIGVGAFTRCSGEVTVNCNFDPHIGYAGNSPFYNSNITVITFNKNTKKIPSYTFAYCESLTSVTIPNSVTAIENYAFEYCSSLTSVNIPDSVKTIGNYAFWYCTSLTSVTIGNSVKTIGNYAFRDCTSLTSITIPNSVTTIGEDAFLRCGNLTSVYISDIAAWCNISFSNTWSNPLYYAYNLYLNNELITDLIIPDSVITIGDRAFFECTNLTSVTIPDSVTSIGYAAFWYCTSLTSVTIGNNVTTIGENAFYGCNSLTSVYCMATTPPALGGTYVFDFNGSGRKIYVPTESVDAYKSATYWREYANAIEGYGGDNLITFTVAGSEYQAEEGMTFYDWGMSEYYDSSINLVTGIVDVTNQDFREGCELYGNTPTQCFNRAGMTYTPNIQLNSVIQPISYIVNAGDF